MVKEIWKPVVGFEGLYEVSNTGLVRSLEREIKYSRKNYGKQNDEIVRIESARLMKLRERPDGRLELTLRKEGVIFHKLLYRIVAEAFIPNPDNLSEVDHIDEDCTNNSVENLQWISGKANRDKYFHSEKKRMEFWSKRTPWNCKQCGVTKYLTPSQHKAIYCSKDCQRKAMRKEPVYCIDCGEEIKRNQQCKYCKHLTTKYHKSKTCKCFSIKCDCSKYYVCPVCAQKMKVIGGK